MSSEHDEIDEKDTHLLLKPAKMGENYVFWIPKKIIKSGKIEPDFFYDCTFKKSYKA